MLFPRFIKKAVSVTRLGEVGVGQNCFLYDDGGDSVLLVDCGIKPQTYLERKISGKEGWGYPPNLDILDAALKKKKQPVAVATHGHLDHIGAMGEIVKRGIPIYVSAWSRSFLKRYSEDMGIPDDAEFNVVAENDEITHGKFGIKFIPLEHSIPGTFGLLISARGKNILHLTDFKFNAVDSRAKNFETTLRTIKKDAGRINCLLLDVLNSDFNGFTPPERFATDEIERIIREAEGRVIISHFSSNLFRMKAIIEAAQRAKKTVGLVGKMSMGRSYEQIERELSEPLPLLSPQNCQVLLVGGSQGEENSGLVRMAMGEHPYVKIRRGDTVVISARCIPGNEEPVRNLLTRLNRQNVIIVIHNGEKNKLGLNFRVTERPVHFSGHEYGDGLGLVVRITDPDVIAPIHAPLDRITLFEQMLHGLPVKGRVVRLGAGETFRV